MEKEYQERESGKNWVEKMYLPKGGLDEILSDVKKDYGEIQ